MSDSLDDFVQDLQEQKLGSKLLEQVLLLQARNHQESF